MAAANIAPLLLPSPPTINIVQMKKVKLSTKKFGNTLLVYMAKNAPPSEYITDPIIHVFFLPLSTSLPKLSDVFLTLLIHAIR